MNTNVSETPRAKGGRPEVEDDLKRDKRLVTRMTGHEFRKIELAFKEWKIGKSVRRADYIRDRLLKSVESEKAAPVSRGEEAEKLIELTQVLYGIRQELRTISTNYNQVVKKINSIDHTGRLYYEIKTSEEVMRKSSSIINDLDTIMRKLTSQVFPANDDHTLNNR